MNDFSTLPPEISQAIDTVAKRRAKSDDADELLFARLEVLNELRGNLKAAGQETASRLRGNPEITWNEIAARLGIALNAAWNRYSTSGTTTPESRLEQSKRAQRRVNSPDLPGVTVTQAAAATGLYRDRIRRLIESNPDSDWFVRFESQGKRPSTVRIVDLEGMKAAAK